MNNSTPTEKPIKSSDQKPTTTPLRCITGALMAGGIGIALYSLTASIAQNFASKPVHSNNQLVVNIAAAVRTLVVGIAALGTGIFGIVAIGLVALAIQLSIQKITRTPPSSPS